MQRQSSGLLLPPCFYLEHNNMFPKAKVCRVQYQNRPPGSVGAPTLVTGLLSHDQQGAPENYILMALFFLMASK